MGVSKDMVTLEEVSFSYQGASQTIHAVSLSAKAGECVVLMGASGSGKTTVTRLINGLAGGYYAGCATGVISLGGTPVQKLEVWQRSELVGSVFQDPATQFFSAQLAGEVAFGCENLGYSYETVIEKTDHAISKLHLENLRSNKIDLLSSGQKQRVAIASAVAPEPSVIVMDEPSSNLDEAATIELGRTLVTLKSLGYTIVIAEHRVAYLMDVADRFYFVEAGRMIKTFSREQMMGLSDDERQTMGIRSSLPVRRPILDAPSRFMEAYELDVGEVRKELKGEKACFAEGDAFVHLRDVSLSIKKKAIFSSVSFGLQKGQILALTGVNGAGKTSLAKTIAGLYKETTGTISIDGKALKPSQRRKKVWYSSNDVSAEFFTSSVGEEVMLLVGPTEENLEHARRVLKNLGLYEMRDRHPALLSGGQKQRLSIACGLVLRRDVLILDEPTSGLDAINMNKLAEALRVAAGEGQVVIVVTHDNEFMQSCCTLEQKI